MICAYHVVPGALPSPSAGFPATRASARRSGLRSWRCFRNLAWEECTEAMLTRYSLINTCFWQRLKRNELSKKQILIGRFEQFFGEYGIDVQKNPLPKEICVDYVISDLHEFFNCL